MTNIQAAMVADNMGLVHMQANRFRNHPTYEDILSAGTEGLCKAVRKWDPKQYKISTYSYLWIKAGMQKELRRQRETTEDMSETVRKVGWAENTLLLKGLKPSDESVAEESGIDLKKVKKARTYEAPLRLDVTGLDDPGSPYNYLPVYDDLAEVEVRELLATIPGEEARAIAYNLLGYSRREAGVIEGVSGSTIDTRRHRGMATLKEQHG